ncbi:MAG: hypothetical protein NW214_15600 [Pseudanabaenaceae cyanobacterium bins.39]|nr:hypothetical protein [Pseudanabaenaceae cyanobacterium bins.39]
MQKHLNKFFVGFQNITRSKDLSALHYQYSHPSDGFNNGIAMMVDIELLSKSNIVLAFPGSQIFWWLERKQKSENLGFKLIPVNPDFFNWIYASFMVVRLLGFKAFLNFLRNQKSILLQHIRSKKNINR